MVLWVRLHCEVLILLTLVGTGLSESWHFTGENIALNKPSEQGPGTKSVVHNGKTYIGSSRLAVDGNKANKFFSGSCSHTEGGTEPYWSVDLGNPYFVKGVRIYTRQDADKQHFDNFKVLGFPTMTILYDDAIANPKVAQHAIIDIPVSPTQFSNITITLPGDKRVLLLCEVEIYGVRDLNYCASPNTDSKLLWSVSYGYTDTERNLVVEDSIVDVSCPQYYTLSGPDRATCLATGNYGPSNPRCLETPCQSPSAIQNGTYNQSPKLEYSYYETVTWECSEGYKSDQNRTRQCLPTSKWSGIEPVCTLITCPFPSITTVAFLTLADGSAYTSGPIQNRMSVKVTCEECFAASVSRITCGLDEKWDNIPMCSHIDCDGLGSLPGGNYTYKDNDGKLLDSTDEKFACGTVVEVYCGDNYKTIANNRTCGADGSAKWSGNGVSCESLLTGEETSGPPVAIIGGAVAAFVALAAVAGVFIFVLLRRRKRATEERHKGPLFKGSSNSVAFDNLQDKASNIETADKPDVGNGYMHRGASNDETNLDAPSSVHGKVELTRDTEYEQPVTGKEDETDTYYSFGTGIPPRAIKVSDLTQLILFTESTEAKLKDEFAKFPVGMVKPHDYALKMKSKNRYRELFAYDDTRVVLSVWDPSTDTDYINACYIHGFNEPKSYIASQGPVKKIINDFWRMVWQTNSDKIVMLTNLFEAGKMKCDQYWPDSGTERYGPIRVTLESTDAFSNFVIRTFLVEKKGEPKRRVKQFHFTAWPDKDVPSFCSSLVHFRYKVKAAAGDAGRPIVVHCSAGVGRTGTFIAIDFLVDQAKEMDYVDVAGCVEALRKQRVDMVQKEKQYVFVHKALIEVLELKTSAVPTSKFAELYRYLMDTSSGKRKMDDEYEMLWKLGPDRKPATENGDKVKEAKSRFSTYYTNDEFMPSLSEPGLGQYGEYINATFLPMYRDADAMIITQTPLATTMEDFWNVVYHQQVHIIVMMNNETQIKHPEEKYWPNTNRKVTYGCNTIYNKGNKKKDGHTIVHLTLTSGGMERHISLIQYRKWVDGTQLPDDPKHMLSVLEIVQENQRQTGNHPMLVHCMDGVERSGLFCVVAATLDRAKIEQDVAISQIIQEMRKRRPNVIPNVEQFRFCHDVVNTFLENFETYSNFSFDVQDRVQ